MLGVLVVVYLTVGCQAAPTRALLSARTWNLLKAKTCADNWNSDAAGGTEKEATLAACGASCDATKGCDWFGYAAAGNTCGNNCWKKQSCTGVCVRMTKPSSGCNAGKPPAGGATCYDMYQMVAAPPPKPPQPTWPNFQNQAALAASPWSKYYTAVYGQLPTNFPVSPRDFWMLHDSEVKASGVQIPGANPVAKCPPATPPVGTHYQKNNMYEPPHYSWIWHPYPYTAIAANNWAEVTHMADPFGDEHYGLWFVYSPGMGVWWNVGTTIVFQDHDAGYTKFGIKSNEGMCKAAAAQNFDSIQFVAHVDHVNYPCDTHNTGNAGLAYMGLEIVAVKLTGTYTCGCAGNPPACAAEFKTGWGASKPCGVCNNAASFLNCANAPSSAALQGIVNSSIQPIIV